jgi:hypothetical protein
MAKLILIEDPGRWETVREFLQECGKGAVVFGPDAVRALKERYGAEAVDIRLDGRIVAYDFGGEADLWLDWHEGGGLDHYCMDAIREHLGVPGDEEAGGEVSYHPRKENDRR